MKPYIGIHISMLLGLLIFSPLQTMGQNPEEPENVINENNITKEASGDTEGSRSKINTEEQISGIPKKTFSAAPTSHKTVYFNFTCTNCKDQIGKSINEKVRDRLKSISNLHLMSNEEIQHHLKGKRLRPCRSEPCAVQEGKSVKAHRSVIGNIKGREEVTKQKLSKQGEYQYIFKITRKRFYTIKMQLVDINSGELVTDFEKEAEEKDLDEIINAMIGNLEQHFHPRELPKQKEKIHPSKFELKPLAAFALSNMVPVGKFKDIINYGFGFSLSGGVRDFIFPNTILMFTAGFYGCVANSSKVTSFYTMPLFLQGGYSFNIMNTFNIVPLLGFGYHIHFVSGEEHEGTQAYNDPMVALRFEFNYNIFENIYLTATPGYTIFFEEDGTGMYLTLDIGIMYYF